MIASNAGSRILNDLFGGWKMGANRGERGLRGDGEKVVDLSCEKRV